MQERDASIWKVIAASAAGTMIEWYDFYIFGSLAAIMQHAYSSVHNPHRQPRDIRAGVAELA